MPFLGGRASASRGFFGGGSTPTAPTGLSSIEGNQQLTVSFNAPSFNGGLNIGNYEYALSTNSGSSYGAWTPFSPVDTTSPVVISGLSNGQQYYVKLRATNALGAGQESDPLSTNTTPFTTPGAPTISVARQASQTLRITLVSAAPPNGRTVTGYQYRIKSSGAYGSYQALSGTTGPWDIGSLTNGTSYTVQVRGINVGGNGDGSNEPSAIPFTVPAKANTPTSESGDRYFTIKDFAVSSDGGSAVTGWRFQLSSDGGATWGSTGTTTSTSKTWTVENDGTSYVGRVQAFNIAGDGEYSNASTARTPAFGSGGTISAVEQTVTAPSYNESTGALATAGVGTQNQRFFTVSFDPPNVSNFSYARVYQSSDAVNWTEIKYVTSNGADSVTSNSITPGAAVYFKMTTWNTNGNSVDSGRVDKTASGYKYFTYYDTSNRTHDSGISYVDSNSYNNEINSAEFGTDSEIISVRVYASSESGTDNICTTKRYFRYAWKAGTDYSAGFTTGSGLVAPFNNNSGTTYQNLDIGASTGYGTGMRFKVVGAGSIVSGWIPRIRVYYKITYRNRYTGSW